MTAAALVNTHRNGVEMLPDAASLCHFLDRYQISGPREVSEPELRSIRSLRAQILAIWATREPEQVALIVNQLLDDAAARPRLTAHDGWDWHLHFTRPQAPLVERLGTEIAMGLADIVRSDDLDRLQYCRAPDCDAVLVDLSRNHSRMYCDTGNCGNRQHAAAYRARRRNS